MQIVFLVFDFVSLVGFALAIPYLYFRLEYELALFALLYLLFITIYSIPRALKKIKVSNA